MSVTSECSGSRDGRNGCRPTACTAAGMRCRSRRRDRFADAPDTLHGPVPGPLVLFRVAIAAGLTLVRPGLDEILDDETRPAEEANPLAVGDLEVDLIAPIDAVQAKVVVDQRAREAILRHVLADKADGGRAAEGKEPTGTEDAADFGHRPVGIGERHRAPVAEDNVERRIGEGDVLGTRLHQRKGSPRFGLTGASMVELSR